jgi:hypothetical protein
LNLGTTTTLTIAAGTITVTRSHHLVDTEAAAATDTLTDINGGAVGDVLYLRSASGARTVTLSSAGSVTMILQRGPVKLDIRTPVVLHYVAVPGAGNYWVDERIAILVSGGANVAVTGFLFPQGTVRTDQLDAASYGATLSLMPRLEAREHLFEQASAAAYASVGMAAGTNSGAGAVTNVNDDNFPFVSQAIAAAGATFGGRKSTTFNLFRHYHAPYFCHIMKTHSDITNTRIWIGLCSAQVTNVDALAAGTHFAGFRFSTVAGDTNWQAVFNDGAVQSTIDTGVPVVLSSIYLFEVYLNQNATYWSITPYGGTATTALWSTNLPGLSQDLGWTASAITTTASAKAYVFNRFFVEYN